MHNALIMALTMILVFTGQSMAQARGMAPAADKMVICTGLGPKVIYTDVEGNPTDAPQICPDCALSVIQGLLSPEFVLTGVSTWHKISAKHHAQSQPCFSVQAPQARDPPWQL